MKKDKSKYGKGHGTLLIILVAIGLFIFGYVKGWGADWKLYGKDHTKSLCYYDAETITYSSKDTVKVWEKTVYSDKGVIEAVANLGPKYKDLDHDMWLLEFNCADRKMRDLNLGLYSRDGSVLSAKTFETHGWDEIGPDTLREDLYKIVCKQPKK